MMVIILTIGSKGTGQIKGKPRQAKNPSTLWTARGKIIVKRAIPKCAPQQKMMNYASVNKLATQNEVVAVSLGKATLNQER